MAGPERIHAVPRRGAVEMYRETACPDCGATVFIAEDDAAARRFDDLEVFGAHRCHGVPVARTAVAAAAAPARGARAEHHPRTAAGFPVDLGIVSAEAAAEFRTMVEAAFGKPLRRYTGVLKGKGLPIHFTPAWEPALGHVPEFSKSDVHRPLAATAQVFALAIPKVRDHFAKESGTTLRKYYFSSRGVAKYERDRAAHKDKVHHVIVWRIPLR